MYAKSFGEITLPSVVLTTDAARLGFDNLSSVTTDDVEAAECAMEYLLESGHRRIGVIAGDLSCSGPSRLRYEGCLLALERCGLTCRTNAAPRRAMPFRTATTPPCGFWSSRD